MNDQTWLAKRRRLLSVARGESPADLLLANARVVNVFTGEIEQANVAICDDTIAGVGDYCKANSSINLDGKFVAPGLINGHTHIESSLLDVPQYAQAVVPRGTLAVVTDLHEIANVCGLAGMRYVLNCARQLPFDLFLMAPSCVPASPLETSGAAIGPEEIRQVMKWPDCIGLGEVMDFPGVLSGDESVLTKLQFAGNKAVDGHAPGISGKDLNAYIAAGIHSDHESVSLKEAKEKLARGMYLMIREGSSEKNLDSLLPLVTDKTYKRCLFVVDDRNCTDLLNSGDIDAVVRKAIQRGLDPVRAVQLATINSAEYFRLDKIGAVAPGYTANLIVVDDLSDFAVESVFYHGRLVARQGRPLFTSRHCVRRGVTNTINLKPLSRRSLRLAAKGKTALIIEVVPDQIITKKSTQKVKIDPSGSIIPDIEHDVLKLVVVERHKATGNVGVGLVKGFRLKRGGLASSVAHDSHNIIAVGTNDEDILSAVREVQRLQGGLVAVAGGKVLTSLALPIAGLLSDAPLTKVAAQHEKLEQVARALGTGLDSPFATLSFLALPVIPELKLTDFGLVDVNKFQLVGENISTAAPNKVE